MNEVRVIGVDVLTDGTGLSKVVLGGSGSRDKRRGTRKHGGSWAAPTQGMQANAQQSRCSGKAVTSSRAKIEYLLKSRVSNGDILLLRVGRFLSLLKHHIICD